MTKIGIDLSTTELPKLDFKLRCSEHSKYESEVGFGLAGGGYGTYSYCTICGKILSKNLEDDES